MHEWVDTTFQGFLFESQNQIFAYILQWVYKNGYGHRQEIYFEEIFALHCWTLNKFNLSYQRIISCPFFVVSQDDVSMQKELVQSDHQHPKYHGLLKTINLSNFSVYQLF